MTPGMQASLFGCLTDPVGSLVTLFCPCVVAAFNTARVDNRECTLCDLTANDYQTRQSLRARYSVGYAPLPDCCSMVCCQCCFIVQTAKEIAMRRGDSPVYVGEVSCNLMGGR